MSKKKSFSVSKLNLKRFLPVALLVLGLSAAKVAFTSPSLDISSSAASKSCHPAKSDSKCKNASVGDRIGGGICEKTRTEKRKDSKTGKSTNIPICSFVKSKDAPTPTKTVPTVSDWSTTTCPNSSLVSYVTPEKVRNGYKCVTNESGKYFYCPIAWVTYDYNRDGITDLWECRGQNL